MLRRCLSLLLALLLLCTGWSGAARASVGVQEPVRSVVPLQAEVGCGLLVFPEGPACRPELPAPAAEVTGLVELADVLCLPVEPASTSFGLGAHPRPHPALETGHPAPCLAGLLRPPSRNA
jgi:hypothetical protein